MNTQKLFETDSHLAEFDAIVISCYEIHQHNGVVLDKTAFFPEGGGQKADTGIIGKAEVIDVQYIEGEIVHICSAPVDQTSVHCKIDWDKRFLRMQNHTGEHVFSGIVHSLTGFDNVGFHMGDEFMTIDFSGELTSEQIRQIEQLSNEAVYKNLNVRTFYPTSDELKNMNYRSKLELSDGVRIVEIEDIDLCACCAPHVKRTGEIGIIKVLSSMRHRGGTRIFITCGKSALSDYIEKDSEAQKIGELLSAKRKEIFSAVENLHDALLTSRATIASLKNKYLKCLSGSIKKSEGNIYIFEEDLLMDELRALVNECASKTDKIIAAFSGNDENGYIYVIYSSSIDVANMSKLINQSLNGKGGGKGRMIQGNFCCKKEQIIAFFDKAIDIKTSK